MTRKMKIKLMKMKLMKMIKSLFMFVSVFMGLILFYFSNQDSEESHGGGKKSGSESEHACTSLWSLRINCGSWNSWGIQGVHELLDTHLKFNAS